MESLLPLLAPILGTSLARVADPVADTAPTPLSASTQATGAPPPPPAAAAPTILAPPATVPSSASTIASPLAKDPIIRLPFQFYVRGLGNNESDVNDIIIASQPEIIKLLAPYRRARLVSLEAVIAPLATVTSGGLSVIALWLPANAPALTDNQAYNVPGAQLVTYTGATVSGAATVIPAPLNALNPMLKDSVPYTDTPRFHTTNYNTGSNPLAATVFVRGLVEVSSPALTPLLS